jgi:peroxiredoxin
MYRLTTFAGLIFLFIMLKAQTNRSVEDANGLEIGVKAPLFEAIDSDSNTFLLKDALKSGPVVLIFYRGHWCPICSKHLAKVQDSLQYIYNKGATVIAVSPQKPEYLNKMADKTGAKFSLLYDEAYHISNAYDVTFLPKSNKLRVYNSMLNAELKQSHSDDSQRLPIPATYIIDKEGIIVWRHFDRNYKARSNVREIVDVLSGMLKE